jgi:asparagine synthase (glutamine-hydrolysing)
MTPVDTTLVLGTPRWPGGVSSWSEAIAAFGPEGAAARAEGGFAVGMGLPDGRVFLAVDRFARETLCYRVSGSSLQFAERADVLGGTDIDPQALFDYLYFHMIPSPRTVFKGVQRLPPGHCVLFDRGQLAVSPFWRPTFRPAATASFNDLRQEFLGLLRLSVQDQLDGSTPACFLSGGTDSSTVAGLICELAGRPAITYSIGFDAQGYDEMAYARLAAKRYGCDHREHYVTPQDLVDGIPLVAAGYDQPFGNSSALPAYHCALKAKGDGISRLLAGDGGDELFGGNSRYAIQRLFGWYGRVPQAVRSSLMEPFFGLPTVARTPILKKGTGYITQAKVPLPDRLQMYNLLRRLGMADVLSPAFLAAVDTDDVLRQQREVWSAADATTDLDRMLAYDFRYTLAESDLPKVRGTTQLAGIGVGFPLLDDRLLDFSALLPTHYKLRGMKLRWFFKEALRGFLPDEIITKKKHGFGLPFGVWATQHKGLRALATDSLHSLAGRGLVQRPFIDGLLGTHLPAHPGYYGEMVWILMMLEQWLRAKAPDYRMQA